MLRKCVCCGKEYDYCPNCHKNNQPGWMTTFCSQPCKELFNVVSAYNVKRVDKAAVRKFINEHKIDESKYLNPIKKVLDEVRETPTLHEAIMPIEKADTIETKVNNVSETETNSGFESRRRNKKRRNRQVDIELR